MSPRRVYWVWSLLAVGLVALLVAASSRWYGFEADTSDEGGFFGDGDGVDAPRLQLHTDFWIDGHLQFETFGGGGGGADQFPRIAQVMETFRLFYLVGLVGAAAATVGLLFRLRGLPERKAFVATLAAFSAGAIVFAVTVFSLQIPDAYERELEDVRGERPDLALFTLGEPDEGATWSDAESRPGAGWYIAIVGTLAFGAAFVLAYLGDIRRLSTVLTDDAAAAENYARVTRQRDAQGIERFRKEGGR